MIAYVWCYLVGIYIHENIKKIKVLHHDRRTKSLFKYGLEYISQCSVNVWVIPRKLLNLQMIDNEWQKVVESGSDRKGGGI